MFEAASPELVAKFAPWINLTDYTVFDVCLVGVGTLFWVICYIAVIKNGFKRKFVEMPMFLAAGNIAWEFVWSFIYKTNMGDFYLWGYRAWFLLDILIFYLVIKYGAKQMKNATLKKYFVPMFIGCTVWFGFFFYVFKGGGYDTDIGATSAYFLSVGISTMYIVLLLTNGDVNNFSWTGAWTRACGDIIMTVFVLHYYNNDVAGLGVHNLLLVMGIYVGVLDIIYVAMVYKRRKLARAAGTLA